MFVHRCRRSFNKESADGAYVKVFNDTKDGSCVRIPTSLLLCRGTQGLLVISCREGCPFGWPSFMS